ncbi:MAG: TetR/AcrR family transcriptional regulator [Firmicutes bacterium]|nr:TetR/AcrR family transcriptional regulator [Bacillota bacterium]
MSPRIPAENKRLKEERKEEILQAAAKVLAYKGYAATKIADIAAAAKVSHGLVYHYFKSKEEIYLALADRIGQAAAALRLSLAQPGAPREKVRMMLERMLAAVRDYPEHYVLAVQMMTTEGVAPAALEKVFTGGREGQEAMAQVIAAGQAAGVFRPGDPRQHFYLLYAAINGLAIVQAFSRRSGQMMADVSAETIMRLIEP